VQQVGVKFYVRNIGAWDFLFYATEIRKNSRK